jgi:hypothetical protein
MYSKLFILLLIISIPVLSNAQVQVISTTRLDEIKLKMPVDSVNKFFDKKLQVKDSPYEFSTDTIWVNYKNDSVRLIFSRFIDEKKMIQTSLQNIYCASGNLKTKSGIKPGDNKFDIIKKLDGSTMRLAPDWYFENAPDKKLYSSVVLYDYTNDNILIFHFKNNGLYAFESALLVSED